MKISFIAPAHRTHLWRGFYDSIITNLDWEVIFVTDTYPMAKEIEGLERLKWIYSEVKPAQCFEIAYREAKGDYIVWTGDDFMYSPYALDNVFIMYKSLHDYKSMISFTIYENGEQTIQNHKLPWDHNYQLTTSALISTEAIEEVGGLADITFECGHWDVDLMMRIYAKGGKVYVCPNAFAYEPHILFHKKESNFFPTWKDELDYFTSLWCKDGKTTLERQSEFKPYIEENILIESQGRKGRWK